MHLVHPMMQRALSVLTRRRYPGSGSEVSRWTVRLGSVPDGAEAVVLRCMQFSMARSVQFSMVIDTTAMDQL